MFEKIFKPKPKTEIPPNPQTAERELAVETLEKRIEKLEGRLIEISEKIGNYIEKYQNNKDPILMRKVNELENERNDISGEIQGLRKMLPDNDKKS